MQVVRYGLQCVQAETLVRPSLTLQLLSCVIMISMGLIWIGSIQVLKIEVSRVSYGDEMIGADKTRWETRRRRKPRCASEGTQRCIWNKLFDHGDTANLILYAAINAFTLHLLTESGYLRGFDIHSMEPYVDWFNFMC